MSRVRVHRAPRGGAELRVYFRKNKHELLPAGVPRLSAGEMAFSDYVILRNFIAELRGR